MRAELLLAAASSAVLAGLAAYARRRLMWEREARRILSFWFEGDLDELYASRWFVPSGSPAQRSLDGKIREDFGPLLAWAARGGLEGCSTTPRTALALILLLDQLSRHVHREERAQLASTDAAALGVCEALLARGWEKELTSPELVFALMPLRHQPSLARLQRVLAVVDDRIAVEEGNAKLLAKFRRHTQLRLLHLQGEGDPQDILQKEVGAE